MGDDTRGRRLSEAECERLVTQYAPLVKGIAQSLLRRLPPAVQLDDLMQDGYIGLLGALLHATRTGAGGQFHSYLSQRIRGAMLDGLRDNDPATRTVRRDMRRVEAAISRLSHLHGRPPAEGEVAELLGMALADYQALLQDAHGYALFFIEDFDGEDGGRSYLDWCATTNSDPLAALERKALQRTLLMAISELSEREEQVLNGYYIDGLTMRLLGEQLGVTEGRVSQLHAQAIAKLRAAVVAAESARGLLAPRWRTA